MLTTTGSTVDEATLRYRASKYDCQACLDISDVRAKELQNAEFKAMFEAINRAQAVIEFNLDGNVITRQRQLPGPWAIRSRRSRASTTACSSRRPTRKPRVPGVLGRARRGEYQAGEYKRIGKGGREVWIQASYNPILDLNGKPCKVVKFATDITQQVRMRDRSMAERARRASRRAPTSLGRRRGRAVRRQPADERQRRGDLGAGQRRLRRRRAGEQQRADRGHRHRGDERQHPRDRQERGRGRQGRAPGGQRWRRQPTPPSPSSARAAPRSARSSRSSPPSPSRPTCWRSTPPSRRRAPARRARASRSSPTR